MQHLVLWAVVGLFLSLPAYSQDEFGDNLVSFPEGYTPREVGSLLGHRFLNGKHLLHEGKWIHYAEVCTWYGALKYAGAAKDDKLCRALKEKFDTFWEKESQYLPPMNHVDLNMFGSLPFELYLATRDKKYYDLAMPYADSQWATPPADAPLQERVYARDGYSWQTRLWIDDMYMITILQAQAYRASGDSKYLNRAAREMVYYLQELQRSNGLFFHAPDVPYYWARGNGWMAVGMCEMLKALPKDHPDRPYILESYHKMMETLKEYQNMEGTWNQLIDKVDCWPETSGSAMFAYAMITGVKHGWLEEDEYTPVARKAWMGLVPYITKEGDVREVCVGTNKKNDEQYYYDRPRITGDYHGQAPYLWCAYALMENVEGK